jgi:hypothetical protein
MKHRMYERILYDTYTKLNKGLDYIHDVWGHGCPLGMDPITPEELEYDRRSSHYIGCEDRCLRGCSIHYLKEDGEAYRRHPESIYNRKNFDKLTFDVKDYLYDDREAYNKHLTSIGQWPMECNKKLMTEDRYKYQRNSIFRNFNY